jgi:hypothetical protein
MTPATIVFVPIPIPVGSGNVGWARRCPPPSYPQDKRSTIWPPTPKQIPDNAARKMLSEARRVIALSREQKALRQNG